MFKEQRTQPMFSWEMIGDISLGRPNLGHSMNLAVYRLMQFTLRDILIKTYGPEKADQLFFEAGELAGVQFYRSMVSKDMAFNAFIREVTELMTTLGIGILRVEEAEPEKMVLTVSEDLDCSGLPVCNETICTYDEGFLSGLLSEYAGVPMQAREVDCWCSGERICRFEVRKADHAHG